MHGWGYRGGFELALKARNLHFWKMHIFLKIRFGDSFKKIIVVKDRIKLWRNEEGIVIMGIMDFLLNPNSLEL